MMVLFEGRELSQVLTAAMGNVLAIVPVGV